MPIPLSDTLISNDYSTFVMSVKPPLLERVSRRKIITSILPFFSVNLSEFYNNFPKTICKQDMSVVTIFFEFASKSL
jgi:hypothetical protein